MASSGPSDDDINHLLSICPMPRAHATILLRKYNTFEQALNSYFDDPDGSIKEQLPANQWGPADNLPGFRIDSDDATTLPALPAPSRPPSRVEQGSFDPAAAGVGGQFNQQDEDSDLQKALAMSREDMSGQESGVIKKEPHFGPANRPHYDTDQWAMTATYSSREIIEHPPPSKRQRISSQPAFLRGSPETGYLAPMLNIYHSIPLAREAFLFPSFGVLTYGYDPAWWMGTSDENSKSISIRVSDNNDRDRHNLLAELQSLMAFLDGTRRAYGSVDALADLHVLKNYNAETPLSRLLEVWVATAIQQDPGEQLTQIFTSAAIKDPHVEGASFVRRDFLCLEVPINPLLNQNLIDILDSTIWCDGITSIDDVWMEFCAEVFTMRLHHPQRKGSGLGLDIPAVWYPERYLYNCREVARQMRLELVDLRKEINQCSLVQRRCESAQAPDKRVINIREVLQAAANISANVSSNSTFSANELSSSTSAASSQSGESNGQLEAQLKAVLERIDDKVKLLEQRKLELQDKMREVSMSMTQPSESPRSTSQMEYILQGVSTKQHITYVRQRNPEAPSLVDVGDSVNKLPTWQWWRLSWHKDGDLPPPGSESQTQTQASLQSQNGGEADHSTAGVQSGDTSAAYSVRMVTEAEVLNAASTECDSVLLVYARQSALDFQVDTTSPVLRKLVEQDNRSFQCELNEEAGRLGRRDSLETNTTIMDEIPLESDGLVAPGMTPMSTTSPPRGQDGQPTPKRAKSEDLYYPEQDSDDEPPRYHAVSDVGQMQERKGNRIGLIADRMLDKVEDGDVMQSEEADGPVHIEHATQPLR